MEAHQLFFNTQQLKKKPRRSKIEFPPQDSIYTTPHFVNPSNLQTNHSSNSRLSVDSNPSRYEHHFINPKPIRIVPSLQQSQSTRPLDQSHQRSMMKNPYANPKLAEMARKVELLRRTVSEKKIASENKLNDMAIRSQRLKEKYMEQGRRL